MNKATTTFGKTTFTKVTHLTQNLIQPRSTSSSTNTSLNKISTHFKNLSTYFDKKVAPKIKRFSRKFTLTLIIWCIIGVAAKLAVAQLPSLMEETPTVFNVATFGLRFAETFFTYISACISDIIESFKSFSLFSPFKAFASFFKNLNIFGTLL